MMRAKANIYSKGANVKVNPIEVPVRLTAQQPATKLAKFAKVPWGTITGIVNVAAGVLFAISSGAMTMAGALPDGISDKVGGALSLGGLFAAALAAGLLAVGRGLNNIGEGQKDIAVAQVISKPTQNQTVNVNADDQNEIG